ncbi:MAG: hypothetical protein ACLTSZ_19915 [Lachnospiraceae bacterium]
MTEGITPVVLGSQGETELFTDDRGICVRSRCRMVPICSGRRRCRPSTGQ